MIWGASQQQNEPDFFFFDLIRKYVVVFGYQFNSIVVQRTLANNVVTDIKVPLEFAQKSKTLVRLEGDPDLDRPFSTLLPIMTFEMSPPGLQYDPQARKITALAKNVVRDPTNKNAFQVQYAPVPYNLFFELNIYAKYLEDASKIVEQIIPMFQPDVTPIVELIPEMNEIRNIPIELMSGLDFVDLFDKDLKTRRMIVYTLKFRMRVWFWGPIRPKPMIKFASLNLRAGISTNNQITVNYVNASGNLGSLQQQSNVYTYYANNAQMGTGIIKECSLSNNTSGTLRIELLTGNLNSTLYTSGNTTTVPLATTNGFSYGIYDSYGNFTPTPLIAETLEMQVTETANGQPTSNVSESINWTLIDINDDFGFGTQYEAGQID